MKVGDVLCERLTGAQIDGALAECLGGRMIDHDDPSKTWRVVNRIDIGAERIRLRTFAGTEWGVRRDLLTIMRRSVVFASADGPAPQVIAYDLDGVSGLLSATVLLSAAEAQA